MLMANRMISLATLRSLVRSECGTANRLPRVRFPRMPILADSGYPEQHSVSRNSGSEDLAAHLSDLYCLIKSVNDYQ